MTVPQGDLPDGLAAVGATIGLAWTGVITSAAGASVDVSQYNSVLIEIGPGQANWPVAISYSWYDQFGGVLVDQGLLCAAATSVPLNGINPSWVLPVKAGTLQLGTATAFSYSGRVIGQPGYADWQMCYESDPARPLTLLIPANAAANSVIPFATSFVPLDTPPRFPNVTSYNGQIVLALNTAAGTNGAVEAVWPDAQGNAITTPLLIDSGGGMRSQLLVHPRAFCSWQYRLSAVGPAAAHNAFLSIIPS